MMLETKKKPTYCDRIYEKICNDIVGGVYPVGSKLPSRRSLREKVHASIFPIHQAMVRLEAEGYVERRHGSGVYVRDRPVALDMADSAMLCIRATGHVYSELNALLHKRLHDLGLFAATLDSVHGSAVALLRRAQYSHSRFILMDGSAPFPFEALEAAMFARKHVIAVLRWDSELLSDQIHRILVDYAAGTRLLADHLWATGHRRLLVVAPGHMLWAAAQWDGQGVCPAEWNRLGAGLEGLWIRRGGRATRLECHFERTQGPAFDEEALSGILSGRDAPTAVVGLRDVDTWCVREALRQTWPEALQRLTFTGDGDTPWSKTSYPPFTTLNWNLDQIADLACGIIRDVKAGQTFSEPVVRLIPPRLVVR